MLPKVKGLLLASHLAPTVVMSSISFIFAFKYLSLSASLPMTATVLSGQLLTGWSNDYLDRGRDLTLARSNKPLVTGLISSNLLGRSIICDLLLLFALTAAGAMGYVGGALHLLAVASAVSYNFWFKKTVLSPLPYIISFGLLPIAILTCAHQPAQVWMAGVGAMFGVGIHFINVVADVEGDISTGVRGLPQRLGEKISILITSIAFITAGGLLSINVGSPAPLIFSLFSSALFLSIPKKVLFPIAMAIGLGELLLLVRYS